MAIRTLTWRGFRSIAPQVALPRETQAAATVVQQLDASAEKLAKAQTPEAVRDILSEGFAQAMLSLALRRDPHVSMWGRAIYQFHATNATTMAPAQIFGASQSAGSAGSGQPGVSNNLLSPRKVLKPCLLHNITASLVLLGTPAQLAQMLAYGRIALQRGKESIFELPLSVALSGICWVDHTTTYQAPIIDVEMSAGGGIELEGHGAPYSAADDIGIELSFDGAIASGGTSTTGNLATIIVRADGEAME